MMLGDVDGPPGGQSLVVTKPLRVAMTLEQLWHRVPGGTAVAAIGMARALKNRDEVHVCGVAAAHRSPPAPDFPSPVEVRKLPLPRTALYESWHRFRAPKVQRATGAIDVIHATTIAIPPKSAPLVVTIHDLAFLHEPAHFTARGMRFFERGLVLAQRDADLVLCPSEATMRDCEAHGFDPDRLRVVPFGVDLRRASEADVSATRSHYSIPGPYILWTGTIEPRKNLRGLIGAFRALDRDVDLVLAGPAGWNEDLDALVAGQRERIKPLGFVPDADLRALYAGAELFCYPSLREGFGFPVLEAMAQGTPVVTSAGTSTEGVAGGAASLVDPHDPQAIAGAMRALLDDRALRDRLSQAGAQRARAFTWEHTAEELVKAYEDVAT